MRGEHRKPYGLYIALFGAAIVAGAYMAGLREEWVNAIGFIVFALGLGIYITGLGGSLLYQVRGQKGVHHDDTAVAATVIIRCMLAISVADNHLDDKEVRTIIKIYEKLTGSVIAEQTVREIAAAMQAEGTDLPTELANTKGVLDKELKNKIVLASLYILAADGVVEDAEAQTLNTIRKGLGVPKGKFNAMKQKFLKDRGLG